MKKAKLIAIRKTAKGNWQGICDIEGKTEDVSLGSEYTNGSDIMVRKVKIDNRYIYIGYQVVE